MELRFQARQVLNLQQRVSLELDESLDELKYLTQEYFGVDTEKFKILVKELMIEANDPDNFSEEYEYGNFYLKDNVKKLDDSLNLAFDVHKTEIRNSNLPYIFHAYGVGLILARLGFPDYVINSGILHDVIESDNCKQNHINRMKEIGLNVYDNVKYVSTKKIKDPNIKDKELYQRIENRSMVNVSPKILKLADGLVNNYDLYGMRENDHFSREERMQRFKNVLKKHPLTYAYTIDQLGLIRIKEDDERFLLKQYFEEKLKN